MRSVLSYFSAPALALFFSVAASAEPPPDDHVNIIVTLKKSDLHANSGKADIVGANVVLVIDASNSIDEKENEKMMSGVQRAVLSDQTDYGDCKAMTVIRYASGVRAGTTHIVCSKEAAQKFVTEELVYYPMTKPGIQYNSLGNDTDIGTTLDAARLIFMSEATILNITPLKRSIIFLGDGEANEGKLELLPDVIQLAKDFGVTSHAIPIADTANEQDTAKAQDFYAHQLITPANLSYIDVEVFGTTSMPVQPGQYINAKDFADVERSMTLMLNNGGF